MARTERITSVEAADRKGCTRQNINNAIRTKKIDAERFGRAYIILANQKFQEWTPNPKIQAARRKKPAKRVKK